MPPSDLASLHAIVDGRVQGVGFRHFVWMTALELDLVGWVRNLDDGRVEVLAEGSRAHLDLLLENLRRGPRAAFVSQVQFEWGVPSGKFDSFYINHSYFD